MTDATMKICIVGISLAKGGAERSMAMLTDMLTEKGFDVHLVLLSDIINYPFSGTLFNLGQIKNTSGNALPFRVSRFKKLRKYLKSHQFDYIIDHRPKNDYLREVFYRNYIYRGMKTIYVLHSSKQDLIVKKAPHKFKNIFGSNYCNVAVSRYIETDILKANGIDNATTIYNAYDPQWKNYDLSKPESLGDKTYILSYGRIDDSIKDFKFLMDAFDKSELWHNAVYLVILGDGKDQNMLATYAASKAASEFILFHPLTPNPFAYVYNSKFVTLTSNYEGFPMVLLEALSLGVPVVSLDIISGPNEIIDNKVNGLLVTERKPAIFADAMKRMFQEAALYEGFKLRAVQSVAQFSKQEISEKWEKLLKNE
ncbi:glycosyltransferase [Psychroserpens sp. BH13MA-6]